MGERSVVDCRGVVPLVVRYYRQPGNGAGGSCHVVLDDGNVETSSVEFCLDWCNSEGDPDGAALMRLFLALSLTQRRKVLRLAKAILREVRDDE